MSDIVLEYAGTSSERFEAWNRTIESVAFARDYGPAHGQPGYDEVQRQAARAIELLRPHLDGLGELIEVGEPFVAAHLESIQRSLEESKQRASRRTHGDVSLDLSLIMGSIEVLLLGLIGPEGQSPVAPGQIELPTQPYFAAWLAAATGCLNLVPSVESNQTICWRTERAFLLPEQARKIARVEPKDVPFEACCAVLERWNEQSSSKVWVASDTKGEAYRYNDWQAVFREGLNQLQMGLEEIADADEIYLGWTTWYGYE